VTAVRVRVPATSANLGPAFDCAGLALTRHDVLEFEVLDTGLSVEVSGVGAGELPTDESHLVGPRLPRRVRGARLVPVRAARRRREHHSAGAGDGLLRRGRRRRVVGAWALCPDVDGIDETPSCG
jgi:homoserine kinase